MINNMMTRGGGLAIVIPCHNEFDRLDMRYWHSLLESKVNLLFVDDCSTDMTLNKLKELSSYKNFQILHLSKNVGKSNAIRLGFLELVQTSNLSNGDILGFLDADSAFSITDILELIELSHMLRPGKAGFDALWSSRVLLSGRNIERKLYRHFLSRTLATYFGVFDRNLPYDTQSGLKLFQYSQTLQEVIDKPFSTRWFIDLEIYCRYQDITGNRMKIWEHPLKNWNEVKASKIKFRNLLSLISEVLYITIRLIGR